MKKKIIIPESVYGLFCEKGNNKYLHLFMYMLYSEKNGVVYEECSELGRELSFLDIDINSAIEYLINKQLISKVTDNMRFKAEIAANNLMYGIPSFIILNPENYNISYIVDNAVKEALEKENGINEDSFCIDIDNNVFFSNNDVNNLFIDYLDMRKKIKKPATKRAIELLIKKLRSMSNNNDGRCAIIEQSIINNWQDLFHAKEVVYEKRETIMFNREKKTEIKPTDIKREDRLSFPSYNN